MRSSDPSSWMWSEALDMMARAERMHREMFRPHRPEASLQCWEPPVDVIETEGAVVVLTALPGVDPDDVATTIEDAILVISGRRTLPSELRTATIHRLELPQGTFRRRVPLPPGRYDDIRRSSWNGCVVVTLHKLTSVR